MKQKSRIPMKSKKIAIQEKMQKLLLGVLLFCVCIVMSGFVSQKVSAASATISVDTKSNTVVCGDTVYVVITVSSSEQIKGFEGYFSYDNRFLQFVTGGSVVHGNDDEFQISDMDRTSSANKIKYSIKFRARKKGSTTIELKQPYHVVADDDSSTYMSVSYNALDVVVMDQEDLEKRNSKTESTASPKASENPDENAGKTTSKKDKEPNTTNKPKAQATATPDSTAALQNSKEDNLTKIVSDLSIEIIELKDEELIPSGFKKAEISIDDKTITAYALNGDADSEFVLIYGKATKQDKENENEETFYLYDRSSKTLMPYDKVKSLYRSMNNKDISGQSSERTIQSLKYVIGIMGVFCALMILLAIAFRIRYSNKYH